jgi:hypothetical protein
MMRMNTTTQGWQASDGQLSRSAPRWLTERSFRHGDIPAARQFTRAFGARAHLDPGRLSDFVLAVSEATASATAPGPGSARVRLWVTGTRAYCEVRGDGLLARRTPHGRALRQDEEEALRHWVLQRLADYVSVASGPDGAWVLLSMTVF